MVSQGYLGARTRRPPRQTAVLLGAVAVAGALCGCSSLPQLSDIQLYDATRAKQASTAATDWKAVDVTGVINAEKANLQSLLDAEDTLQDQLARIHVQSELLQFMGVPLNVTVAKQADTTGLLKNVAIQGLAERVQQRMTLLVGTDYVSKTGLKESADSSPVFDVYLQRVNAGADARQKAAATADYLSLVAPQVYSAFKLPLPPSCADTPGQIAGKYSDAITKALVALAKTAPDDAVHAKEELETEIRKRCLDALPADKTQDAFAMTYGTAGTIGKAHADLLVAQAGLAQEKKTASDKEAVYESAQAAYDAKVKAAAGSSTVQADIAKETGDLLNKLKDLEGLSAATGGLSDKYVAQLKLTAIDNYLTELNTAATPKSAAGSVTTAKTPDTATATSTTAATATTTSQAPKGAPVSVNAAILLAQFADDEKAFSQVAPTAQEMPLQIMADQNRLELQAATAVVAARQKAVDLAQQLQDNLIAQATQLLNAHVNLTRAADQQAADGRLGKRGTKLSTAATNCDDGDVIPDSAVLQSYEQQFCKSSPQSRVFLIQAAVAYVDVVGRLEPTHEKLQYAQFDAQDQELLAYSSANLQRWQALIDPSVTGLSDYYASGISPQTIASFLQAAGLVWIGHGVNK